LASGELPVLPTLPSPGASTGPAPDPAGHGAADEPATAPDGTGDDLDSLSEEAFAAVMARCGYRVARVAQVTGSSRAAVYRRIHRSPTLCLADDLEESAIARALAQCDGDVAAAAAGLRVSVDALKRRLRASRRDKPR